MQRLTSRLRRLFGAEQPPPPAPRNKALWAIGIFAGSSPLALREDPAFPGAAITREDVTDVPTAFVADPFLAAVDGTWHMFFELLNRRNGRGEIGLATSSDLASWTYQRVVLAEPFHLSYPQVIEWNGAHYMIPESHQTRTIRLYRGDPFPTRWTLVHTLLSGGVFSDATLFRHDGRWWMLAETSEPRAHDTLRLYHAEELDGPWSEHPASPVVAGDPRRARPAGRVITSDGALLRFAQDCRPRYGMAVNAYEITELTPTTFAERPAVDGPVLRGSGVEDAWNGSRMHHLDAHRVGEGRWVAAVDGARETTAADVANAIRR